MTFVARGRALIRARSRQTTLRSSSDADQKNGGVAVSQKHGAAFAR
jgi:hypothetical protein